MCVIQCYVVWDTNFTWTTPTNRVSLFFPLNMLQFNAVNTLGKMNTQISKGKYPCNWKILRMRFRMKFRKIYRTHRGSSRGYSVYWQAYGFNFIVYSENEFYLCSRKQEQDKNCTYNVQLWSLRLGIVEMETQKWILGLHYWILFQCR